MNFTGTVQKLVEILDLRKKKGFSCDTARVDPWAELFTQYLFGFPEFVILHFCICFYFRVFFCHMRDDASNYDSHAHALACAQ